MSLYPAAAFITSANQAGQFVPDIGAEVAFAGRSNAGKSSAINAILGRKDFARTSKTPGRTQLVNFFSLEAGVRLVDLPGYGFARVPRDVREHWERLMEDYFRGRGSLRGLVVAVDSRRGIGDFDRQMLDYARALGRPAHVLLTKADKLNRREQEDVLAVAREELGAATGVQLFSAVTRLGVDQARAALRRFLQGVADAADHPA
ncbi:MAG: YihA family ribosome biogenesis GTP-binding protein [Chromatiales bacterium]|jgi:GTP-binding protein|nr:YihA family ribosome biogenesis GTP-binding protein [Chromatiales bacterium]